MATLFGGQFLLDVPGTTVAVNLGLTDNGTKPPFPGTVQGALNIEAFTSVPGGTLPPLASGFTAGLIASDTVSGDASPAIVNGFLTGRQLQLFGGDYRVTDSLTGSTQRAPAVILAGSGNQTIVGAGGDTLIGGSGNQVLNAAVASGSESIVGGTGSFTIQGAAGDSIGGNISATSLTGGAINGSSMSVTLSAQGNYRISGGPNTVIGAGSAANAIIETDPGTLVDLTGDTGNNTISAGFRFAGQTGAMVRLGTGNSSVFGGAADTIVAGAGGVAQIVAGTSNSITLGASGLATITSGQGSTITGSTSAANALIRGAQGDRIDLTGATGSYVVIGANSTLFGAASTVAGSGDTVLAGSSSNVILVGGAFDSLVGGSAAAQVFLENSTALLIGKGAETISSGGNNVVTAPVGSNTALAISAGNGDLIDMSNNAGAVGIIGAPGASFTAGSGNTAINGAAGGMSVTFGLSATTSPVTNVSGATTGGAGNTISGVSGSGLGTTLDYNSGASGTSVTGGDVLNLSGWNGNATINAFSTAGTQFATVNDTILAGNGADSVWGGGGDRIGVGSVAGGSTVRPGGSHLWDHSTTVAGASIGFGSNDTVASTTYSTVTGTATRNPGVAGSSSANVTVTNFQSAGDFIFYANESAATNTAIVLTSTATMVGSTPSTMITLPDGTVMTLVGVAAVTPAMFKP